MRTCLPFIFLSRMSYEDKKNGGNTRVKILDTYND